MNTTIISTTSFSTSVNSQCFDQQPHMTSLEIAELTGKPHNDVMKAIRKMDGASHGDGHPRNWYRIT